MKLPRLFRTRDKPVRDATSGSAFSFFMGGSTSGKNVNERSAMQMTAVYACVRILSEGCGRTSAASLQIQRGWRQGKGHGSSSVWAAT